MGLFKSKKEVAPPVETATATVKVGPDIPRPPEPAEITLQDVISQSSQAWYQAQVLEQLSATNQLLTRVIEVLETIQKDNK